MDRESCAELLVRALKHLGVERCFGLPGTGILSILDACARHDLPFIGVRHESAAVLMAGALSRVTRGVGVCLVTEGPGHANAIGALAALHAEDIPVLLISGRAESAAWGRGAIQELPQVELARPITRFAETVTTPGDLLPMLTAAWRAVGSGAPGPVHLTIPVDVLDADAPADAAMPRADDAYGAGAVDLAAVTEAADLLGEAERPAIVAGTSAWWHDAGPALERLVQKARIPVFTTEAARGLLSDESDTCFGGAPGGRNPMSSMLREADLVLLVGERLDYWFGHGDAFARDARLVRVFPDASELERNRRADVGTTASPAWFMDRLEALAPAPTRERAAWIERLAAAKAAQRARISEMAKTDEVPIHPLRVAAAALPYAGEGTSLVVDGSNFGSWVRLLLPARTPGAFFSTGRFGMVGGALTAAIAARAARPDRRVLAFSGDGGIGFYFMEFETALRASLPLVMVIGNDAAWGIETLFQESLYGPGRSPSTNLSPTRYDEMVRAMGGHGEHVEHPRELAPAFERAFASGTVACINVAIGRPPSASADSLTSYLKRRRATFLGSGS